MNDLFSVNTTLIVKTTGGICFFPQWVVKFIRGPRRKTVLTTVTQTRSGKVNTTLSKRTDLLEENISVLPFNRSNKNIQKPGRDAKSPDLISVTVYLQWKIFQFVQINKHERTLLKKWRLDLYFCNRIKSPYNKYRIKSPSPNISISLWMSWLWRRHVRDLLHFTSITAQSSYSAVFMGQFYHKLSFTIY